MDKIDKFCVLDNVKSKEELHRIALESVGRHKHLQG